MRSAVSGIHTAYWPLGTVRAATWDGLSSHIGLFLSCHLGLPHRARYVVDEVIVNARHHPVRWDRTEAVPSAERAKRARVQR